MIVVDTNVIGYLFLTSEHSALAEQAWRLDPHWVAPLLWRSELRNVLAHYVRQAYLSLADAQQIMQQAAAMMHHREFQTDAVQVLQLATAGACSAYDCEFVALAQYLQLPLVTVDKQLLRHFPETAVSLAAFCG